jgi:tetratricopeptide (TPR) repeat protein
MTMWVLALVVLQADRLPAYAQQPSIKADSGRVAMFKRRRIAYQEVRWRRTHSHFEKADRLVPGHGEYSHRAAKLALDLGDYGTAVHHYEVILDQVRKGKGEDARDQAIVMNNLATLYWSQDQYRDAEALLKKVIAIGEKAQPLIIPMSPQVTTISRCSTRLRAVMGRQSRYTQRHGIYEQP